MHSSEAISFQAKNWGFYSNYGGQKKIRLSSNKTFGKLIQSVYMAHLKKILTKPLRELQKVQNLYCAC